MAEKDIKWIKISSGIFDDDAFQLIDAMPEADAIELIWFKLLVFAGASNNQGVFLYKDKIAYTDEMLAAVFHRPLNIVRLALNTFEKLGMIEQIDNVYAIPSWNKYQSLDAYERKKERDRLYQQERREKQKLLIEDKKSSDNRLTVGRDCSYSISNSISKKNINTKHIYGEYKHVRLTDKQYKDLLLDYGQGKLDKCIQILDEYCEQSGKTYKNYNLVLRGWVKDEFKRRYPNFESSEVKPKRTTEQDEKELSKFIRGE